jgi:hypothetical protein
MPTIHSARYNEFYEIYVTIQIKFYNIYNEFKHIMYNYSVKNEQLHLFDILPKNFLKCLHNQLTSIH